MAGLVVVEGPNRGAIHALRPDLTRLGRDAGCEVVVLDDRASRVHAEVVVRGEEHARQETSEAIEALRRFLQVAPAHPYADDARRAL